MKLFSEKGFHASTTSEIVKEAGVAEGTIFRHYKTKKDILLAVVVPLLVKFLSPRMLRDVQAIFGDPSLSTEETLRRVCKNRLELVEQNWDRFRILLQEAAFHPEIREAIIEHIAKRARTLMTSFVEKKIRDGEFRNLPPAVIVRVGFSLLAGYVFFKHIAFPDEGIKLDDDEEIACAGWASIKLHARLSCGCVHCGRREGDAFSLARVEPVVDGIGGGAYHGNRQTVVGRMPDSFRMKGR